MFNPQAKPIHHENKALGVSFTLPARLTPLMDSKFWDGVERMRSLCESFGHPFTGALERGGITGAAMEAGIVQEWKCDTMPAMPTDMKEIDLRVVYWVAPIISEYVTTRIAVPKVSFWRRVGQRLLEALNRTRSNSD